MFLTSKATVISRSTVSLFLMLGLFFAPDLWAYSDSKVFRVEDFGAKGDGLSDDGPAIRAAISEACLVDGAEVEFDDKLYYFGSTDKAFHLEIINKRNVSIVGNGASFLLDPCCGFLNVDGSNNIDISNFSIDYNPLTFSQGVVKSVDVDDSFIMLEVDEGFPAPNPKLMKEVHGDSEDVDWGWGVVLDKFDGGVYKIPAGLRSHLRIKDIKKSKSYYKIFVRKEYKDQISKIKVGYVFFMPLMVSPDGRSMKGGTVVVRRSGGILFSDIEVYSARSGVFLNLTKNVGELVLYGLAIKIKEGTDRVASIWRDGVHAKDNKIGPKIIGCFFEGLLDDSINIGSNASMVTETISSGEYLFTKNDYNIGDHLSVFTPLSDHVDEVQVVAFGEFEGKKTIKLSDDRLKVVKGEMRKNRDSKSTQFYNMSYSNTGFVVANNVFRFQRRHAALIRASHGFFFGNYVDGVSGSGISIGNETGSFYEGPFPVGVVVLNNVFKNTGDIAIKVYSDAVSGGFRPVNNILVVRNKVENSGNGGSIFFRNAEGVIVGNDIDGELLLR